MSNRHLRINSHYHVSSRKASSHHAGPSSWDHSGAEQLNLYPWFILRCTVKCAIILCCFFDFSHYPTDKFIYFLAELNNANEFLNLSLKLVIKSMTYGYSSIRGTNTLYVKQIGFVEMQCASAIWYLTDYFQLPATVWLVWALHLLSQSWCCLSYWHISVCTATAQRRTFQPGCCPLELTLNSFVRSSTAPAHLCCQVCGKTPNHALLMTCQKGRASHASA